MKKSKLPSFVSILVLTLVTVIVWVSFDIYRTITQKPSPVVSNEILDPVSPKFDSDTVKKIDSGIFLDSSQVPQNVINQTVNTQTPIATIMPRTTPTPIATRSASLNL